MAKSFLLILLALVVLVRCQLGQESRILNNGGATRNQPPVLMRGGPTSGDLRNLQVWVIFLMTMTMMKADTSPSSFDQVFEDTPVGTTVYTLIGQVRLPCSLLISSESIKAWRIFINTVPKWSTAFRIQRALGCFTRSAEIISASTQILAKSLLSRCCSLPFSYHAHYYALILKLIILWTFHSKPRKSCKLLQYA